MMKKRTNNVILQRSELMKKFAENIPAVTDKMRFLLEGPEFGWMDLYFYINDGEEQGFSISNVYNPFQDIKEWLEHIVKHRFDFIPSAVNIDCESCNVVMYYEPLFYTSDEQLFGKPLMNGLFYIYDSLGEEIMLSAYYNTKELVRLLYTTIRDHAKGLLEHRYEDWMDDWILPEADKEKHYKDEEEKIQDIFNRLFISDIIEKYLADMNNEMRFKKIR